MSNEKEDSPIVLVTGSGRGLGRGIAVELAKNGFSVAVHYGSSSVGAQETITLCEEVKQNESQLFECFQADLSDEVSRKSLIPSIIKKLGFIDSLIDNLSATYRIDEERVYAVGYSNGAMLAFGLACYLGERIAAVGSVSGTMLTDIGNLCQPPQPTAVITLHGTQDYILPYYKAVNVSNPKGDSSGYVSAEGVVEYWVDFNQTQSSSTKETTISSGQTVHSFVYAGGQEGVEVQHHQVIGGEHVWFDLQVLGFGTCLLYTSDAADE